MQLIELIMRYKCKSKTNCLKIDQELTKLYYSIGEVSEMFDVSNSLIRYWESEFKILKPTKNSKGDRRFMVKDIRNLERIYTLVKERGFTLDGAKKELSNKKKKPANDELLKKLKGIRKSLNALLEEI